MNAATVHLLWSNGHEWAPEDEVCPGGPAPTHTATPASPVACLHSVRVTPMQGTLREPSSPSLTQTQPTPPTSGSGVKSLVSTGKCACPGGGAGIPETSPGLQSPRKQTGREAQHSNPQSVADEHRNTASPAANPHPPRVCRTRTVLLIFKLSAGHLRCPHRPRIKVLRGNDTALASKYPSSRTRLGSSLAYTISGG